MEKLILTVETKDMRAEEVMDLLARAGFKGETVVPGR